MENRKGKGKGKETEIKGTGAILKGYIRYERRRRRRKRRGRRRRTRPDTRHKMRLVCVRFTFENNTGYTDLRTDGRTDTTSYRDATAHLKRRSR